MYKTNLIEDLMLIIRMNLSVNYPCKLDGRIIILVMIQIIFFQPKTP